MGRAAALRLSWTFVDLDDLTTEALGAASVGEALRRGAAEFRRAEVGALVEALKGDRKVLALGGGTPTAPGAADVLRRAQRGGAVIVYLRASAATLRARLAGQVGDRPSLTGADPLVEIETVLAQRDGPYLSLADVVLDVDGLAEAEVVDRVARLATP